MVETVTWKIEFISLLQPCILQPCTFSDVSLASSGLKSALWPCRWLFVHCMCRVPDTVLEFVRLFFKQEKDAYGEWFASPPPLTVWEKRWLSLLLSIGVTMTGDGGENDFGFCSDALLRRIRPCCRLLAGPVSLACVTCASRRVSRNNFARLCLWMFVCARAVPLKDLSSRLPEQSEPWDCSGLTPESILLQRSRAGQHRVRKGWYLRNTF